MTLDEWGQWSLMAPVYPKASLRSVHQSNTEMSQRNRVQKAGEGNL